MQLVRIKWWQFVFTGCVLILSSFQSLICVQRFNEGRVNVVIFFSGKKKCVVCCLLFIILFLMLWFSQLSHCFLFVLDSFPVSLSVFQWRTSLCFTSCLCHPSLSSPVQSSLFVLTSCFVFCEFAGQHHLFCFLAVPPCPTISDPRRLNTKRASSWSSRSRCLLAVVFFYCTFSLITCVFPLRSCTHFPHGPR